MTLDPSRMYVQMGAGARYESKARQIRRDMVGFRVGRLVVVGPAASRRVYGRSRDYSTYWKCRCCCGRERYIRQERLTSKVRPTRSCGCARLDAIASKDRVGTLYRHYQKNVLQHFRYRRRPKFDLTRQEFERLIFDDCVYCGRSPHLKIKSDRQNRMRNTIDRLDPRGSYSAANCVTACWPCNRMKRTLSVREFVETAQRIAAHAAATALLERCG